MLTLLLGQHLNPRTFKHRRVGTSRQGCQVSAYPQVGLLAIQRCRKEVTPEGIEGVSSRLCIVGRIVEEDEIKSGK